MPLAEQITVFLWTLAIGIMAGFCHVIYRAISDTLKLKKVGTIAGDIIFWTILTAISFAVLLRANYGQLRFYVFIGLFLGAFLFTRCLGRYSYGLIRWLFRAAGRVAKFIAGLLYYAWRMLIFPFKIVFIVVVFPVQLFARLLGGLGRLAGRVAGNPYERVKGKFTSLFRHILGSLKMRR